MTTSQVEKLTKVLEPSPKPILRDAVSLPKIRPSSEDSFVETISQKTEEEKLVSKMHKVPIKTIKQAVLFSQEQLESLCQKMKKEAAIVYTLIKNNNKGDLGKNL